MSVKIETILTDSDGNRIVVTQEYLDIVSLVDKNIDQIEDLVVKAKKDISVLAEQELLNLNQTKYSEKKKKEGYLLNGNNSVTIRTLNGKQNFKNQRFTSKDKLTNCTFLDTECSAIGQQNGYQTKGVLELMSNYVCKLSYEETSKLLERFIGEHIYTANQIQKKVVALEPIVSEHLQSTYNNLQLSFNFTETNKDFLYEKDSKEICYFDDAVGVTKQKEKRQNKNYKKEGKYVQTDVVLIQNPDDSFQYLSENKHIHSGLDLETQISCHLSLIGQSTNGILSFVAITDGARSIRCRIERLLGKDTCIILDWYHLVKKIWEYMSRLAQGKAKKEYHTNQVLWYLWHGWVTEALIYMEQKIHVVTARQHVLEELENYIIKHKHEIIDYDTRWRFAGKAIGSGRGEKANDQIVAIRQKHDGKSWSEEGSHAMTTLHRLNVNKQWDLFWNIAA